MTEYWVSKKQYWCKYCNIWIRDDPPSRKQHETGLKHQGNRERFIRDLYKGGDKAKREKAAEAMEMARIESQAAAAYAKDTHTTAPPRQSVLSRLQASSAASSSRKREGVKDTWANYSTAKQLGFDDEDTQKSTYEIEQMVRGRAGEVGAWQTVEEPVSQQWSEVNEAGKRKLGEYGVDEEDGENFKFQHRDKRAVNDVWDEEDWDPKKGLRVRVKEERRFGERGGRVDGAEGRSGEVPERAGEGSLKREGWSGRLELTVEGSGKGKEKEREGLAHTSNGGGWVKVGPSMNGTSRVPSVEATGKGVSEVGDRNRDGVSSKAEPPELDGIDNGSSQPADPPLLDIKPDLDTPSLALNSLFKKRRPPPASRKK